MMQNEAVKKFDAYYDRFMEMKKAEIIREGMTWGVWANYESNFHALMKWKKVHLARHLAERLVRLENYGY
jgi:hypothetical protein